MASLPHCWDTTKSIIVDKEPPYADPHVRWCGRSENKVGRKLTFVFLLPDYLFCYQKVYNFYSAVSGAENVTFRLGLNSASAVGPVRIPL